MYENGFGDPSLFKVTNYNVQFKYKNILVYLDTLYPEISMFIWTPCFPKYLCLFGYPVSRNIHVYLDTLYLEISIFIWTPCIPKYPWVFGHPLSGIIHVYLDTKYPCLFGHPPKYPCLFGHTVYRNINFYLDTLSPEISMLIWTPFISKYSYLFGHSDSVSRNIHFFWTPCI